MAAINLMSGAFAPPFATTPNLAVADFDSWDGEIIVTAECGDQTADLVGG